LVLILRGRHDSLALPSKVIIEGYGAVRFR